MLYALVSNHMLTHDGQAVNHPDVTVGSTGITSKGTSDFTSLLAAIQRLPKELQDITDHGITTVHVADMVFSRRSSCV
jgi:hypothetical protein